MKNETCNSTSNLYSPRFEHDACGIGAVVDTQGRPSHETVDRALKIVEKLEHRAGKDASGETGDGVGILVQISHRFFSAVLAELSIQLGGLPVLPVSAKTGENIPQLRQALVQCIPDDFWANSITGDLAQAGDTVLLVMPQDIQAPKGRLILPQVQTIRELLDKKCSVMSCTADCLEQTLSALAKPPKLIITDSQAFPTVWAAKPEESLLTSFSILFAGYKGDITVFRKGAAALAGLTEDAKILVAEACAHAPTTEDIGRVKIPNLLRKKIGEGLSFDFVRGNDFPQDLTPYDLVIHCGACMFNRRHVLNRIAQAEEQGVPICNYGIVLAAMTGILDKVVYPND